MRTALLILGVLWIVVPLASAQETADKRTAEIASALQEVSAKLAADPQRDELRQALGRLLREQIAAANRRSSAEWSRIASREDWERFRAEKIKALRESLGTLPERPATPKLLVTRELAGDGFTIRNVVYQSRPGLVVTANLYVPDQPRQSMPGILLSHSHHNPKHEGELQDMGMTWARAGCYVLVPDHLGHGERRQHPFATAADFAGQFPVSRQDYNFRYDTSLQLYLVGESLMGWMVHDLMTGVDVLLAQPGIDPKRIILLGAVAGGGDPAGVTATLDERIACVVPFNFGGPQPENRYPLPDDAETSFNYAGGGSWESTRNLRNSASAGFLPWVIVGSVAPRKLIHAHEFSWDRERDPVWNRYEKIWGFYDAADGLAFAHGRGTIHTNEPPGSHCNNIGAVHRRQIHEAFRQWFAIDVKPEDEYQKRKSREELTCLTNAARQEFQPKPLYELLTTIANEQLTHARASLAKLPPAEQRKRIVEGWTDLALDAPFGDWSMSGSALRDLDKSGQIASREIIVRRGDDAAAQRQSARALMLVPKKDGDRKRPLVIAIAEEGPTGFLKHRSQELTALLSHGAAVALVDVVGTGELGEGDGHGQNSSGSAHSATQLMLGPPLLAKQTRFLRSLLATFRMQYFVDDKRIIVWGDSFTDPLAAETTFHYPRRIDRPGECTPTGPLLALLFAASDPHVAGVLARGSLVSQLSMLNSPYVQVPHACCLPGALQHGDLSDLIAALAPRPVVLEGLVDGRNRLVPAMVAAKTYETARATYANQKAPEKLVLRDRSDAKAILEILAWRSDVPAADRVLEFSNQK